MFGFLTKNKVHELFSPVVGEMIKIEDVPDKVFASKMLGDGVGFVFLGDTIYAPCNAKVTMVPETKHAIGLDADGIEILIHIGLDTVNLNGEGFTAFVTAGDTVKKGDVLLKIDREYMKEKGIDLTSPMIITSEDKKLIISSPSKVDLDSMVVKIA